MAAVYVQEQGARIEVEAERLVVRRGSDVRAQIPLANLDQLTILGNVQVTTQALQFLSGHGVDTFFLTQNGTYRAHLRSAGSTSVALKARQFEAAGRPEVVLALAQSFVLGKIANQTAVCARRRRNLDPDAIHSLRRCRQRVHRATTLEALRGIEGTASRIYFRAWPAWLVEDFGFTGRARRPPTDLVNALLSLGYTLLAGEVTAALYHAGLEPYLGFLHAARSGHPALASDLMEEFRGPVVDLLVLGLLNRREIRLEHAVHEGSAVHLNDAARRTFFTAYRLRLETAITDPRRHVQSTYRTVIRGQVEHLCELLRAGSARYVPFLLRE
ncbi:MAG: CRISPR-associated endonuclease Cas1 [Candidatus Latescibacterota bacterium]